MERITRRGRSGFAMLNRGYKPTEAWDRLAAYEDIGLMPDEIEGRLDAALWIPEDRYDEIIRAEAEERLIVLPCKVGDTVYVILPAPNKHIVEGMLSRFSHIGEGLSCHVSYCNGKGERCTMFGWVGENVFTSLEEAEAALEKKVGNG